MTKTYKTSKRIGIIGGMGPAATVRLYQEITDKTPISSEQDHLRLVIDSDPTTPDRTAALLGRGPSPEGHLLAAARRLASAGAQVIVIACNTAHAWFEKTAAAVHVPVLNLIDVAGQAVSKRCPTPANVGLLATDGTLAAGLYQRVLQRQGMAVLVPDPGGQQEVMEAIMQIKRGQVEAARASIHRQAERLIAAGAAASLVGCTDISVVLKDGDLPIPVIDSTTALAERIIAEAREESLR
jgi:aspartate racemase